MNPRALPLALCLLTAGLGCTRRLVPAEPHVDPGPPATPAVPRVYLPPLEGEPQLGEVRQLTFEGENAEAYWSWDGSSLVMQSKLPGTGCDRIFRMPLESGARIPVSSGQGATTCSYFFPGDRELVYASTHLAGAACPPPPDRSQGYVWALHPSYDLFKVSIEGGPATRLTDTPGYDAEATVCGKDGSIVFTSVRDGDLELYRMDRDGKNVKRLTNLPGYDGGAFFNTDCSRIVWRASRPKAGAELDEYRALLAKNLVRPSKLELYVANADGSEATQVTYLDAASFAPYFHPSGKRILFSSNYGDPQGREFDIFSVDVTGARLARVTATPGFDGFPVFSPDGTKLAFASNRRTPAGSHDTHVFVARFIDTDPIPVARTPADRIQADVEFLADPAREGRGLGTRGLASAGEFIESRLRALGVTPAGDTAYRQPFEVPMKLELAATTALEIDGKRVDATAFVPLGFSPAKSRASGELVFANYGIVDAAHQLDDYAGVAVRGNIAVVRRFVPEHPAFEKTEAKRRFGDLRYKAWLAKERGARALVVVDEPAPPANAPPTWKAPDEAPLPALAPEGYGDAGIPVVVVRRAVGQPLIQKLVAKQRVSADLVLELATVTERAFNVVGRIPAGVPARERKPGTLVIGAHYDHLGFGGRHSLAPDSKLPHVGADDNASGVAGLLEIARLLVDARASLRRDVVIAAFSGEESGLLGSNHFVRVSEAGKNPALPKKSGFAMLNLDMIGRLRENRLQVLGSDTAGEWAELLQPACDAARVDCALARDGGYGPSDQMSFFLAGVPVLHFFTGAHADYHKPTDTADKVNAAGAAQIARIVADVALSAARRDKPLSFNPGAGAPAPRGDVRSFNASLGTIPDYAGPGPGKTGVLLGGVRPGGAAERGGLKRGDRIVRIGRHQINGIEDLMYVLNTSKPGESTKITVVRAEKELELDVTFQESPGRH